MTTASVAQLRVLGGAMARVPVEATAFAHRTSRIMVNVSATPEAPSTRPGSPPSPPRCARPTEARTSTSWATRAASESAPPTREPTWGRLAAIKKRYDPTNLFRLNQNIPPAREG